ncbi:hypothetical protein IKX64_00090 [Candidatus Saccharibacteria bacterium]|nr:hypothetical protein [Candidatus Saccharibacteria bacterium]
MKENEDFIGDQRIDRMTEGSTWTPILLVAAFMLVVASIKSAGLRPFACWLMFAAVIWAAADIGIHLHLRNGKKKQEEKDEEDDDPTKIYGNTSELMKSASLGAVLERVLEDITREVEMHPELYPEIPEEEVEEIDSRNPCDDCGGDCATCMVRMLNEHPEILDVPIFMIKFTPGQKDRP